MQQPLGSNLSWRISVHDIASSCAGNMTLDSHNSEFCQIRTSSKCIASEIQSALSKYDLLYNIPDP